MSTTEQNIVQKILLLVSYWTQKKKGGPKKTFFELRTSDKVPAKTQENATALGITFASPEDVAAHPELANHPFNTRKTAESKAKAAGFTFITSQTIALNLKKLHAPGGATAGDGIVNAGAGETAATEAGTGVGEVAQAPAEIAPPVQEFSQSQPIEAQPGGAVTGEGGEGVAAEQPPAAAQELTYESELTSRGSVGEGLPIE